VKSEIRAGLLPPVAWARVYRNREFARVSACVEADAMNEQSWIRFATVGLCLSFALGLGYAPYARRPGCIGVTRSFRSFSQALDEVKNARIFAGTSGSPAMTVKPLATKSPTGFSTTRCFPLIER
jgi:hypothetical protein